MATSISALGDGGSSGDPEDRAQNPNELLGKILRLDVNGAAPYAIPPENPFATGGGAPEVFVLGARNPWRISFDGNDIYVADVGQNAWEEINVITTSDAGANLGWNIVEGPECYRADTCDEASGFVAPVHSYSHAETGGCSVTGGYVYRGAAIPEIDGHYFFADYCNSRIQSFAYADGAAGEITDWTEQIGQLGNITLVRTRQRRRALHHHRRRRPLPPDEIPIAQLVDARPPAAMSGAEGP